MDEPTGKYLGRTFGNYQLQQLIGEGGFSEVYQGEQRFLGTPAALKILNTRLTRAEFEQFRQEAQTINRLHHPGIVRLFDFGVEGDIPFMTMSYAPKGSLRALYPAGSRLPLPTVVSLVKQVAAALQYAHEQGIVHRDVKPENLLIGPDGELVLSDFGIAVVLHSTHSLRTQQLVGTVAYMAPEQLRKKAQAASDQYALAVVVYEWLCGELSFEGSPIEVALQHLNEPPPALRGKVPTLPAAVERVVLKALAKEPGQRFPTIQAFADALARAAESPAGDSQALVAAAPHTEALAAAGGTRRVELLGARWPAWRRWPERRGEPVAWPQRRLSVALLLLVVLCLGTASTLWGLSLSHHAQLRVPFVAQTPLLPLGAGPGDWVEPGFDAQNTDDNVSENILSVSNVASLHLLWQTQPPTFGPAIVYNIAFAVAHGVIYFSDARSLIAVNAQSGQVIEKIPMPLGYESTPAIVGDQVFLGMDQGDLLALNLRTRAAVPIGSFRAIVSGLAVPAPVIANGIVYDVAQLQELYAVDAQTDRFLWQTPLSDVTTTPAVADGVVYVGGYQHLYAVNAKTGALLWQSQPQSSGNTSAGAGDYISGFFSPVVGPQYVYDTEDQQVLAYPRDCATPCAPAWSFRSPVAFGSSPALADGVVYATASDGGSHNTLYALDGTTGQVRWSAEPIAGDITAPIIANGVLYLTDWYADLTVYAANGCGASSCQPLWNSMLLDNGEDGRAATRVAGGRCYMLATTGQVVAFGLP